MPNSRFAALLAGASLAACGGGAGDAALASRIEVLEQRLSAADQQQERLLATLRAHGIVFHADPPRDAAEARRRALDDLESALARLQSAKDTQDVAKGQSAVQALDAAVQTLRTDRAAALPALMARAEVAAPAQQAALLECCARVGDAAAAPGLLSLVRATDRQPSLRLAAARALITVDAEAAVPMVAALLEEPEPLPELYLLVHMLAGTGEPEAVAVLVSALRASSDRSVRCHAATGLGNYRSEDSVEALASAALGDEYPAVRTNALRALARAASAQRLREVAQRVAASDADPQVRAVANELAPATTGR